MNNQGYDPMVLKKGLPFGIVLFENTLHAAIA